MLTEAHKRHYELVMHSRCVARAQSICSAPLMQSAIDPKTRRMLDTAARRLDGLYQDVLALHAMGAGIADRGDREIYAKSLRQVLDHLASASRALEELVRPNRPPAP